MRQNLYVNVQIPVCVRRDGSYTVFAVEAEAGVDVRENGEEDDRITHWVTAHIEIPRPQETTECHVEEVKK